MPYTTCREGAGRVGARGPVPSLHRQETVHIIPPLPVCHRQDCITVAGRAQTGRVTAEGGL